MDAVQTDMFWTVATTTTDRPFVSLLSPEVQMVLLANAVVLATMYTGLSTEESSAGRNSPTHDEY